MGSGGNEVSGEEEMELIEPPRDLVNAPVNRVTALMNDPDMLVAAIEDLVRAGVPRDEIFVFSGPRGVERLDITGRHRGLRHLLHRFVERIGDLEDVRIRTAEHIQSGGFAISVPADETQKSMVAEILAHYGAFEMIHHGVFHWERLGKEVDI